MPRPINALWTLLALGAALALTPDPAAAAVAISRQGCVVLAVDAYDNDEAVTIPAAAAGGSQLTSQIEPLTLTCDDNLVTATLNIQFTSPVEMRHTSILICIEPAVPGGCTPEFVGLPQVPSQGMVFDSTAPVGPITQVRTATSVFPNVQPGNYVVSTRIKSIALIDYTIGPRVLTIHAIGQPAATGIGSGRP